MRPTIALALCAGGAATALFATLPWLGTRSRSWILAPHLGAPVGSPRSASGDDRPGGELVALAGRAAARLADGLLGVIEPLSVRLQRVHHRDDPAAFRFRQGAGALVAGVLAATVGLWVAVPVPMAAAVILGLPVIAAVGPEVELSRQGRRWSDAVRSQLPFVGEQLVALLAAGRSPTAALGHVADEDGTPLERDLARVVDHLQRGGALDDGLRRWTAATDVDAAHRLAGVLALHHRTADLAELVRREVDAVRDDLHRELLADIDRRAQKVWIPVTVAALVPGSIFLLVPFFDALRLFGATS